jgi:hypothetical protein
MKKIIILFALFFSCYASAVSTQPVESDVTAYKEIAPTRAI